MQGIGSVKKSGSDIYGMKNENIHAQHGMGSVKDTTRKLTFSDEILGGELNFVTKSQFLVTKCYFRHKKRFFRDEITFRHQFRH